MVSPRPNCEIIGLSFNFTGRCGIDMDHGVTADGYGSSQGTNYITVKNSYGPKAEGLCRINQMASYLTKEN